MKMIPAEIWIQYVLDIGIVCTAFVAVRIAFSVAKYLRRGQ